MTPENFVYWLQGFMELQNPETISSEQVQIIQDHLNLVFKKETPRTLKELTEKYNLFESKYPSTGSLPGSGVLKSDKQLYFNFETPVSC